MEPEERDLPTLLEFMALMRSAQEAERVRVARRLHDEVGQVLAAFRMKCYALDARIRDTDPGIADEISAVMPMLDEATSVVREVSEELRPGSLGLGIEAAIEWQAEQFQAQSEIACVVDIETDQPKLSPNSAIELFRVFQAALANVRLHPGATTVDVTLRPDGNDILLEVCDDGSPPGANASLEHALGILTMKERSKRAGGAFVIADSAIEVRMPLNG